MKQKQMKSKNASTHSSTKCWRQALPNNLFCGTSSQNVFIVQTEDRRLSLYPSSHVGHQFFTSLTELNRKKFVESIHRSPTDVVAPRLSLSVVNTICNEGKGKIYYQEARGSGDQWLDMGSGAEANGLVFEMMACSFNLKSTLKESLYPARNKTRLSIDTPEQRHKSNPPPPAKAHPDTKTKRPHHDAAFRQTSLPPKKRVRFVPSPIPGPSTRRSFQVAMDAAHTLMNITNPQSKHAKEPQYNQDSNSNAGQPRGSRRQTHKPPSSAASPHSAVPPLQLSRSRPKFTSILRVLTKEDQAQRHRGKAVMPTQAVHQNSVPREPRRCRPIIRVSPTESNPVGPALTKTVAVCADGVEVAASDGIPISQVRDTDVLCGGRGQAVLAINHPANKQFREDVKNQVNQYIRLDRTDKVRLAEIMVRLHVESTSPEARFLVMSPTTKLWYPISPPKTLGKVIRTFKFFEHQVLQEANEQMRYLEQVQVELVAVNRRKENLEKILAASRRDRSSVQSNLA